MREAPTSCPRVGIRSSTFGDDDGRVKNGKIMTAVVPNETAKAAAEISPGRVGVLLAEFRAAPQNLINELAVLFLIVRIAYVLTYIGDRPRLRSILWNVGFLINIAIFFMPAIQRLWPG